MNELVMKNQVAFFGEVSRNTAYHFDLDTPPVKLLLCVGDSLDGNFFEKINKILENIQEVVKNATSQLIAGSEPGSEYEGRIQDFMEFMLIHIPGNKPDAYLARFDKRIADISVREFCVNLRLASISFHCDNDEILFDYSYSNDVYDVWALVYDFDLNFLGMGAES